MTDRLPGAPRLPREEPKTAPPPNYAGGRYVSVEMQRVADSDAPPDTTTELVALRAEVKASHAKLEEIERGHVRLSQSDGKQNESLSQHTRDIGLAIGAANEAKAAAEAAKALVAELKPSNDRGAEKATAAAEGIGKLDNKSIATLVSTIVTLVITILGLIAKAQKGEAAPPAAPTPVVVATPVYVLPDGGVVAPSSTVTVRP